MHPTPDPPRNGQELVCHCFGHTREDIARDLAEHGRLTILDHIAHQKQLGRCECVTRNPSGR